MVKRTISRDYRIEGTDYIAIKKEEYDNGKGKHVVNIMEEHNITLDEVNNVIDKLASKELADLKEKEDKYVSEIKEIKEEIKDVVNDPEFLKFIEDIKSEKIKKYFDVMSRQKVLKASEGLLLDIQETRSDVYSWKQQMQDLKQAINEKM